MSVSTDYLQSVYNVQRFQKTADACLRAAEEMMKAHPFDAIAFTGTSGAAMAYILSNMMGIPLICVRKPTENSHYANSGRGVFEGFTASKRYMIVDDFICSGNTIRNIHTAVSERLPDSELVGIVLYAKRPEAAAPFIITKLDYSLMTVPVIGCGQPEDR